MIYFVQAGSDPNAPIKIGYTTSVDTLDERIVRLQTGNPETLYVVALIEGSTLEERQIHRRLAAHRLHGEWFRGDAPEVLAALEDARDAEYLMWDNASLWIDTKARAREVSRLL